MKRGIGIVLFLFILNLSWAQGMGPKGPDGRMRSAKVGFITNRVELTPEQAEKFWPLYNQYMDKKEDLHMDQRKSMMEVQQDGMTDEEAVKMIAAEMKLREEDTNLDKQFIQEIQKVISPVQAFRLMQADRDFNMEVLRNFQHRGEDKRPGMPKRN